MVEDEGEWTAHFISASNTNLAEKYASFFHEDAVYVGCSGMEPKRLYGGGMDSTPFLSALMQLSAIQAVAGVSKGRDVAIGCSVWDCFFGTTRYEDSMNSMWRYLYKVLKLGGAGRIDFSVLYDVTLTGEDMERQKKYVGFCVPFFKSLGAGRRLSITIIDKKLKKQLCQQTITNRP